MPDRYNETIGLQHCKIYVFDDSFIISGANLSQVCFCRFFTWGRCCSSSNGYIWMLLFYDQPLSFLICCSPFLHNFNREKRIRTQVVRVEASVVTTRPLKILPKFRNSQMSIWPSLNLSFIVLSLTELNLTSQSLKEHRMCGKIEVECLF